MSDLTVGIRELKAQLSEYLKRVKAGESIVITERGRPIGRIIPEERSLTERMNRLVEAGFISWNGKPLPPREPAVENRNEQTFSHLISEGRDIDYLP